MLKKRLRASLVLLMLVLAPLCAAQAAFAGASSSDDDPYSDESMAQRFDFVLNVSISPLKDYLTYQGSKYNPVAKVIVNCKNTPRGILDESGATTNAKYQYEELWYHTGLPIGCKRTHLFKISEGSNGALRFLPSQAAIENADAIADVTARLLLDVYLHGGVCNVVIVPQNGYEVTLSALGRLGFFPVTARVETPIGGRINFMLVSDPEDNFRCNKHIVFLESR